MSGRLTVNSTPAERARGAIFAESFRSPAEVILNGGTITGTPDIAHGKVTLNGTTEHINYGSPQLPTTAITVSCWIKANSLSDFRWIVGSNSAVNATDGFMLFWQDNKIKFGINHYSDNMSYKTFLSSDTDWHHVMGVYDKAAGTVKIYVDGVIGTSDTYSSDITYPAGYNLDIGSIDNGTSYFWDGSIEDVKIFDTALTAQEALDYANNATYSYENQATIDLRMGLAQHDPQSTPEAELLADNDMETGDTSAWTVFNSGTLSKETGTRTGGSGTQVLRIAYNSVSNPGTSQNIATIGKTYRVTGWARGDGTGIPRVGDASATRWTGTSSASWQYFDVIYVQAGSGLVYFLSTIAGAGYVEFDDVSVKLVVPRTLDVSGKGKHATFGNGSTSTTYPTKLTDVAGYDLDGGDYLTGTATGAFNTASVGIAFEFTPDFETDENVARYFYNTSTAGRYYMLKHDDSGSHVLLMRLGETTIGSIAEATYSPYWKVGQRNVIVLSGTTGATDVWLNDVQILTADNTAWSAANPANYWVGSNTNGGTNFSGKTHRFRTWQRLITPIQMYDIGIKSRLQANQN